MARPKAPPKLTRRIQRYVRWPYSEGLLTVQNDNAKRWGTGWEARPGRGPRGGRSPLPR